MSNKDDVGGRVDIVKYRIGVAWEDLGVAELLLKEKSYRGANNRSYYAVFHAASACLGLEEKSYRSHAQVLGNFNKEFVHTGVFQRDISKKISALEDLRLDSDYDDLFEVIPEEAEEMYELAKEIVTEIDGYVNKRLAEEAE